MKYGKLNNNVLEFAPSLIQKDGNDIFTTDPTEYGYKQIISSPPVEKEGYDIIQDGYEETENSIIEKWKYLPIEVQKDDTDILLEHIAMLEDALCEIDETNEERIAAIEDALCELDKEETE